jgi:hypothetical protein
VSATAARLLSCKSWADDEAASDLIEVERDWRNDAWSEGSLVWMALATQSLRVAPKVLALGKGHRVHGVFKAVDDLRTAFASLTAPERE